MIAHAESPRVTVLLIKDSPDDARTFEAALRAAAASHGTRAPAFDVVHADRLMSGLQRLARGGVDVVLLDLMLPDSRGLKTLGFVRRQSPDIPVVVLTALDDEPLGIQAVQRGAQDYLIKDLEDRLDGTLVARVLRYAMDRQRLHTTMRQLALTDELTSLYNRHGFFTLCDHQLKRAPRTRGLLLVRAELEGLADIGAQYGQREANRALVKAAELLRAAFRASDIVARLGTNEFAVLVLDAAVESGDLVVARLQQRVEALNAREPRAYRLSLNACVTRFDAHETPTLGALHALAEARRGARSAAIQSGLRESAGQHLV